MSVFHEGLTRDQMLRLARQRRADAVVNRVFDEFEDECDRRESEADR